MAQPTRTVCGQMTAGAVPPIIPPPVIPPPVMALARGRLAANNAGTAPPVVPLRRASVLHRAVGTVLVLGLLAGVIHLLRSVNGVTEQGVMAIIWAAFLGTMFFGRLASNMHPFSIVVGLYLGGLAFFIIDSHSLPDLIKARQALTWPQAECRILSSSRYRGNPRVTYQYNVNDQTYQSDRVDFLAVSDDHGLTRQYAKDSTAVCYYNPANPAEATLLRGLRQEHLIEVWPLGLIGLAAAFLFGGLDRLGVARRPA